MSNPKQPSVAVLMGSDSDLPVMESCIKLLKTFGINPIVRSLSAHRTPGAKLSVTIPDDVLVARGLDNSPSALKDLLRLFDSLGNCGHVVAP